MFLSLLHINAGGNPDHPGQKWLGDIYRIHQRLWMAFPDDKRRTEDPFFLGTWNGPTMSDTKPERSQAGFLFRVERDGTPRILVQSIQRPDWQYAFQNAPSLLENEPKILEYDPEPCANQVYRFRLLANVISRKNVIHPQGEMRTTHSGLTIPRRRRTEILIHPKPIPNPLPDDLTERSKVFRDRWNPWRRWLNDVGDKCGFQVLDDSKSPLLMETVYVCVRQPEKKQINSSPQKPKPKRYNGGLFEGMLVCTDEIQLRNTMIKGIGTAKAFGFGLLSLAAIGEP